MQKQQNQNEVIVEGQSQTITKILGQGTYGVVHNCTSPNGEKALISRDELELLKNQKVNLKNTQLELKQFKREHYSDGIDTSVDLFLLLTPLFFTTQTHQQLIFYQQYKKVLANHQYQSFFKRIFFKLTFFLSFDALSNNDYHQYDADQYIFFYVGHSAFITIFLSSKTTLDIHHFLHNYLPFFRLFLQKN